jgi:predicted nucleic acid-binding protein
LTLLLDTDTLIFVLRAREDVSRRFLQCGPGDVATSSICFGELHYGASKSRFSALHLARLETLKATLTILPITEREAVLFGGVKADLESLGQRLPDADLWIAATAMSHNLTLVSHNQRHFARVPGLKLEDWVKVP